MRYLIGFVFLALAAQGCGKETHGGGSGGSAGGQAQIPSDQATTPEECQWLGTGGDDLLPCEYVTVDFSTALPVDGLRVVATTSVGDVLTPTQENDDWPPLTPSLLLSIGDEETRATGFTIVRAAEQPHYAPAEVAVTVEIDQLAVADQVLEPLYTCVELTGDDWCWKAQALTLTVSLESEENNHDVHP